MKNTRNLWENFETQVRSSVKAENRQIKEGPSIMKSMSVS